MTKPFDIPKALVWKAFQRVRSNGGSAGIDQESIEEFEANLSKNLYKLWNRMVSGSYFPPPVKAVPIPKKSGGARTLGVAIVCSLLAPPVPPPLNIPPRYTCVGLRQRTFDADYFFSSGASSPSAVAAARGG